MRGNLPLVDLQSWRKSYRAALFEKDTQKLPLRIHEARSALVVRSRELLATSPNYSDEAEAVDDALYALKALEDCLKLNTKDRRTADRVCDPLNREKFNRH